MEIKLDAQNKWTDYRSLVIKKDDDNDNMAIVSINGEDTYVDKDELVRAVKVMFG